MINSVLGPIAPDKLGKTLVHEHFIIGQPGWQTDETMFPYDRKAALKTNLEVCKAAREVGIGTIVDCTPNDYTRDPELYKELARKSGINIICVTGLFNGTTGATTYWVAKTMFVKDMPKMMAELFVREINVGIGKTGVKAGAIKVASSETVTPYEESVFKAAIIAQKETGVPIITHTEGPDPGIAQADLFLKEGADKKKVLIGHVSNSTDMNYYKAILDKGFYVGFDRMGMILYTQDEVCIKNISELCKLGYADKIMLSHDTCNYWCGRSLRDIAPPEIVAMLSNWRVDYVSKSILPALKEKGVTDKQINTMMVDNPRSLFTGK
ncbi:MAG: TatD family hydrolase [Dehalococcoidia bacterium]|jgi:phosphotriesterase-related protein